MKSTSVWILVLAVLLLGGCKKSGDRNRDREGGGEAPFRAVVTPALAPADASLVAKDGTPRPVGASRDEAGVQTDFVIGEVLIRPRSTAELDAFLERWGGRVLSDDRIPEPPAELGIALGEEERAPTVLLVSLDLSTADTSRLREDAAIVGLEGTIEVSDDDALRTLAAITEAAATDHMVSANFVDAPTQFPRTLLKTSERGGANAFATNAFGTTGPATNVTLAWQFILSHGIERRVRVAIIDRGFWMDSVGRPMTSPPADGTDLLENVAPPQYDFESDRPLVGAPNPGLCSGRFPCPWHGNMAAGVATGLVDNGAGAAGTGGLVSDPMLFHRGADMLQKGQAIRTAAAWGADVITMSFGGYCNYWCRQAENLIRVVDDYMAYANQKRVVIVASAGNDESNVVKDGGYYHPCLYAHVICVGATMPDGTKWDYSNFGDGVDIWAPADMPVMADGASGGALTSSSGTSASAPFVAGVAAMMKSIDPTLDSDQVARILRDTAHRGSPPVDYSIDAYAALLRVSEGKLAVRDRFEPSGPGAPTEIASVPWEAKDLNLHSGTDVDSFRIQSPSRTNVSFSLTWPRGLGALPVQGLENGGSCGAPVLVSDANPATGPRVLTYQAPAGPAVFTVGGGGPIAAYDIAVSFGPAKSVPKDAYEPNDEIVDARRLTRRVPFLNGGFDYMAFDDDVTIDASIHAPSDIDWFVVQGSSSTPSGGGFFQVHPSVSVYGNESSIAMNVYRFDGGLKGARVGGGELTQCDASGIFATLEAGRPYLVEVKGMSGRYHLTNGVRFQFDKSRLPVAVQESPFDFVKPGPPIDRWLRFPINFVLLGDPAFGEVRLTGKNLHLELFDLAGSRLASGVPNVRGFDEVLDLRGTFLGQAYVLRVTPTAPTDLGHQMMLTWASEPAARSSGNLLRNAGAEEGPDNPGGGPVASIDGWDVYYDGGIALFNRLPTYANYGDPHFPVDASTPGPDDRGSRYFTGGTGRLRPAIYQVVEFDRGWRQAVAEGAVRFELSAFLGGLGDHDEGPILRAWFAGPDAVHLADVVLGPVTPEMRGGQAGLFPVATAGYVPAAALGVIVELWFPYIDDATSAGLADNLELVLHDFAR